jgi:hypothetical protein
MDISEAEHYSPEQRERAIRAMPAHERDARAHGVPLMGKGLIFPVVESDIICEPFAIPSHWPQLIGMDFGYDHPTAAIRMAFDLQNDVIYLVDEYAQGGGTIRSVHASAIKRWGKLPVAWPADGNTEDPTSGITTADQYRKEGLFMWHERATFEDGGHGLEAGLEEMLNRMQTGRWKVFTTCAGWLAERRIYHRKIVQGVGSKVVKEKDDRISASRYGMMMRRIARSVVDMQAKTRHVSRTGSWNPLDLQLGQGR